MIKNSKEVEQHNRDEALAILKRDFKNAYEKRGLDPQISFDLVMSVYERAVEQQFPQIELKALHAICSINHNLSTNTDPYYWIDKLIQRGKELDDSLSIGRAYMHRYGYSRKNGELTAAIQFLMKALEFFDPEKHKLDMSTAYTGLGNIYITLDKYDKALEYYHKGLETLTDSPPDYSFNLRQSIATTYYVKEEYAKAWEYFQDLLTLLTPSDLKTHTLVLQNLGHICYKTNQLAEAESYYQDSLDLKLSNGLNNEIVRTFCHLINAQIALDEKVKVYKNILEAEKFLKPDNPAEKIEILETYLRYYKMINDLPKQIEYYEKLISAKDDLYKKNNLELMHQFEDQHQMSIYKQRSLMLEERNKLAVEQNDELQKSINKLLSKEKTLETKLKNAFMTISKKDDLLAAHHRLAAVGEMIAIIAHQWKQPLNIINSVVFSIKDAYHFNELSEDFINDKAQIVEDLIQYLSQTMNDFRNFFKEQNNIDFKVSDAVKGAVSLLSYALDTENVSVEADLENDFSINGSQNELIQVFLNLINNARDAFKEENVPQRIVKISLDITPESYLISFYDNGGPIPEEMCDNVFDAYVTSKGEKGTGLGLNICQTIIEDRFKGKLFFKNTLDGVTFYIKLPVNAS